MAWVVIADVGYYPQCRLLSRMAAEQHRRLVIAADVGYCRHGIAANRHCNLGYFRRYRLLSLTPAVLADVGY
jgi:hypothetical protein